MLYYLLISFLISQRWYWKIFVVKQRFGPGKFENYRFYKQIIIAITNQLHCDNYYTEKAQSGLSLQSDLGFMTRPLI